jgi:hypothetical protein
MSSIYIKNRSGPNIEPCGTPEVTREVGDDAPLKTTNWCLSAR